MEKFKIADGSKIGSYITKTAQVRWQQDLGTAPLKPPTRSGAAKELVRRLDHERLDAVRSVIGPAVMGAAQRIDLLWCEILDDYDAFARRIDGYNERCRDIIDDLRRVIDGLTLFGSKQRNAVTRKLTGAAWQAWNQEIEAAHHGGQISCRSAAARALRQQVQEQWFEPYEELLGLTVQSIAAAVDALWLDVVEDYLGSDGVAHNVRACTKRFAGLMDHMVQCIMDQMVNIEKAANAQVTSGKEFARRRGLLEGQDVAPTGSETR